MAQVVVRKFDFSTPMGEKATGCGNFSVSRDPKGSAFTFRAKPKRAPLRVAANQTKTSLQPHRRDEILRLDRQQRARQLRQQTFRRVADHHTGHPAASDGAHDQ